jgi:hypothetical protein
MATFSIRFLLMGLALTAASAQPSLRGGNTNTTAIRNGTLDAVQESVVLKVRVGRIAVYHGQGGTCLTSSGKASSRTTLYLTSTPKPTGS